MCDKTTLRKSAVIPMQTGGGKTLSALYSAYKLGERVSITMAPRYMESWIKDIDKFFHNEKRQYLIIDSGLKFKKLIDDAKRDRIRGINIIIFSLNILREYFKEFELTGESSYGCLPKDLYRTLGVGIRITDEAHEDIHFQFRHDIHTHVNRAIYLSATIESLDAFTNKLYGILYPTNSRLSGLVWNKYINGVALGYTLQDPSSAVYLGSKGYSHAKYENYLMSKPKLLNNYLRMCLSFVEKAFVVNYQDGQKLLVYMSRVELCYVFTEYMKEHITNKNLRLSPFTGDDEADTLNVNDILVTTPIKSGTGRDIAGLVAVITTIAIKSMQTNTQMSGRIRPIDKVFPGVKPTFIYLVCTSIPNHVEYHANRMDLFKGQFLTMSTYQTNFVV
jgi:hypothetical protein